MPSCSFISRPILRTGATWADLPDRYPSYQRGHRRFQQWVRSGVLRSSLEDAYESDRLDAELVRYERVAENFLGMLHLACSLILLRRL